MLLLAAPFSDTRLIHHVSDDVFKRCFSFPCFPLFPFRGDSISIIIDTRMSLPEDY